MNSVYRRTAWLVALALAVVAASGCGVLHRAASEAGPRDPFTLRFNGPQVVELTGLAHGHRAGEMARFELTLRNDGSRPAAGGGGERWQERCCLVLVDHKEVRATLAALNIDLAPGAAESRVVQARLPADLAEGCYGLALVLPQRVSTVTLTVGNAEPCAGGWAAPACE